MAPINLPWPSRQVKQAKPDCVAGTTLARPSANPERGVALELPQIVGHQLHFAGDPLGNGVGGERLGLERFRVSDETLVQRQGLLEAFLRRGFGVEPGEPAEINEDGAADLALGGGLQITVILEIETQRGVGSLVGGNAGEDLRCVVERALFGHERGRQLANSHRKMAGKED